jgi:hypothetical protein
MFSVKTVVRLGTCLAVLSGIASMGGEAFADTVMAGTSTLGGLASTPRIIHVENLNDGGPGSLRHALKLEGPRVIVFDVGGTIELKSDLRIDNGEVTIAGQTAPGPGITLSGRTLKIRAGNVAVQHLSVRAWSETPPEKGDARDGITITACDDCETPATDILVENVSVSWSVDEGIGLWGERLERVTIRNAIISEALANAGHPKGEHSMGLLIGGGVKAVEVTGNLFASNMRRNPVVGGGASAYVANNFIYNPGHSSVHVYKGDGTLATLLGNVTKEGPSTKEKISAFQVQGDIAIDSPGAKIYAADNHCCDGRTHDGSPFFAKGELAGEPATASSSWQAMPAGDVWSWVSRFAGSRPGERGGVDTRIISEVEAGGGKIIDTPADVGGDSSAAMVHEVAAVPADPLAMANGLDKTRLAAWLCLKHVEVGGPPTPQCSETKEALLAALGNP